MSSIKDVTVLPVISHVCRLCITHQQLLRYVVVAWKKGKIRFNKLVNKTIFGGEGGEEGGFRTI